MVDMKIIGLTGGIACGKSTISKFLEKNNIKVIDCDVLCNYFYNNLNFIDTLISVFGDKVLNNGVFEKK